MTEHFEIFVEAINRKRILEIIFASKEKGIIKRKCIPFDFGPSRRYKDDFERFHFYDLDSPDGKHNLSILPEQLTQMEVTQAEFDPKDYITWTPNWFLKRNWGLYS